MHRTLFAVFVLISLPDSWLATVARAQAPGIRTAEGFEVTLFADDDLASDIYSMTIDSRGRVAVAGPGYVKLLVDNDGDGRADEARQFSNMPRSGAQGMYFDGDDLLCTGDGGLWRLRDEDGDGRADGSPHKMIPLKTGGEHDAHAIRLGPDGWWYLIAGNSGGLTKDYATLPTTPIRRPNAGGVFRVSRDFRGSEILTDGFRNPYDFAFNGQGDVFVFDSDGERDVSLPWWRPTRVFHALPGANAGWFSRSWKRPDYFVDMPPVVGRFGRGSPTGVACYRHIGFPEAYRGALFVADWTFGRVFALPLRPDGSVWSSQPREFLTGVGQFGFAPTDLAVGPRGALYVCVGGRGSRGGVYRVTSTARRAKTESKLDPLTACLAAPQPLSSWSRARWTPLADKLGAEAIAEAAMDEQRDDEQRIRAIEILVDRFAGIEARTLSRLSGSKSVGVRARAAWSLRYPRDRRRGRDAELIAAFLRKQPPTVARFALESLLGQGSWEGATKLTEPFVEQLASPDPRLRQTAARVVAELDRKVFSRIQSIAAKRSASAELAVTHAAALRADASSLEILRTAARIARNKELPPAPRLEAARIAQLALGDVGGGGRLPAVFDGYSGSDSAGDVTGELRRVLIDLSAAFPSGDERVDHELARALAIRGVSAEDTIDQMLAKIDPTSHPLRDIHYLIAVARLRPADRKSPASKIAHTLLDLERKLRARELKQDSNWEPRIRELYRQLVDSYPDLPRFIADRVGAPGTLLFVDRLSGDVRVRALRRFVQRARSESDYPWDSDLVFALAELKDAGIRDLIRDKHSDFGVQAAVTIVLARAASEEDRPLFFAGLRAAQLDVLANCLSALEKLKPAKTGDELIELLLLARRLGTDRLEIPLRDRAMKQLRRGAGRSFGFAFGARQPQRAVIDRWTAWFSEAHPDAARRRLGADAEDAKSLATRLAEVDWSKGDPTRGEKLFKDRQCAVCHRGRRTLGPDLAGAAKRFSRRDLITAIALPNRDVSPRYQTTGVETTSGKNYVGLVIYNSVDGLTLRNGLNQTIRIEADEIASQRKIPVSLMPGGLLKDFKPRDLADLYAYLQGL